MNRLRGQTPDHDFDRWFDEHHAQVLAFARRRVADRETAEDVVADTFAIAWRRRSGVDEPVLPWLYGVARGVIANHHRGSRRRGRLAVRLAGEPSSSGRDPAQMFEARSTVAAAFRGLSPAQQEVLRLVAWEDLDAESAAVVLGCSSRAFRVRLHRARRALEQNLANEAAATALGEEPA